MDNASKVPLFKNGKLVEDISVAKIEFTSIPHPGECEAAIKVLGTIKGLQLGDIIRIGPTPVNNLGIVGEIVGRDDMDNILLLDTKTIRSIPKKTVLEVATLDLIVFHPNDSIKDVSKKLSEKSVDGAPIVEGNNTVGIVTLHDIVKALAESKEDGKVSDIMAKNVVSVNQDMKIAKAIEIMYKENVGRIIVNNPDDVPIGIITRTDIIDIITDITKFPPIYNNE